MPTFVHPPTRTKSEYWKVNSAFSAISLLSMAWAHVYLIYHCRTINELLTGWNGFVGANATTLKKNQKFRLDLQGHTSQELFANLQVTALTIPNLI